MPVKNDGESDEALSAESEHSSHGGHESSGDDEEANESDDSSEMDMSEIERRRAESLSVIANLECQFQTLREQYYLERIKQLEQQLNAVRNGTSEEYLQPLNELEKVLHNRVEVADVQRKLRLENIEHKYHSELQAAQQNFESEKKLAYDQIHDDLMDKIRRLEEDRHNVDISWADWGTDKRTSKVRGPGRKKAVTVTGPYIVYMLHEEDIIEDWTAIRKATKRSQATAAATAAT
ncbi:breast cancer metastasis-suppressor 1-like protein [Teleopsis dalmanni]|uniref:breast cancer metastasis-suppressor 1-like protein n=1 Tax=Teleopsis dalmanni TaxID=139649 RepID=UPI0018CE2B04|nr:breast cancer metastasis-suppressor 1-like protein [Teleopsis dalmanni]